MNEVPQWMLDIAVKYIAGCDNAGDFATKCGENVEAYRHYAKALGVLEFMLDCGVQRMQLDFLLTTHTRETNRERID